MMIEYMTEKPLLIDTHTHVNFRAYKDDGDKVIQRALDKKIWLINIGSQYSTSRRAVDYAQKYQKGVYAAVGLHPIHVYRGAQEKDWQGKIEEREFEELDLDKYRKLLENDKTVAMGEIGLDYHEGISQEIKDKQKNVLLEQLDLACQMDKPVVFHCRKAYDDLTDLLNFFNLGCASCPHACISKLRGVVHCFMGRWSQAEKFIEMGFFISFNGLITYARDYDKVIERAPLEKILLETDAPYLTPVPHRNERNEPLFVKFVAEKIAQIKKIKFEEVAQQTTKNARELFKI